MFAQDAVVVELAFGLGLINDVEVKLTLSGKRACAAAYSIGNLTRREWAVIEDELSWMSAPH